MIYRITNTGHKFAHPVKNREELMALRNSIENLDNLAKARKGDAEAKGKLLQLAYNLGHVEGEIAGCKSIGSFFFHDIDAYGNVNDNGNVNGNETAMTPAEMKDLILSKKEEIGLLMLEKSANGGWHLVCKRVPGTTILENQVRIATILKIEMDTSTKDLQRVVYSTSGSPEDLVYLDDELFTEPMTTEECEQEYKNLKVRVMRRKENVPEGAKKKDKHYRPWEDDLKADVRSKMEDATTEYSQGEALPLKGDGGAFPTHYHGIPFTDILKKYWEVNNKGFEPKEGDRDTLTFQLACDLRHICGKNFDWLDQVIPCYDNFPLEEKRKKIQSALNSDLEAFPSRLRNTLNALEKEDVKTPLLNREGQGGESIVAGREIDELTPFFLGLLLGLLLRNGWL